MFRAQRYLKQVRNEWVIRTSAPTTLTFVHNTADTTSSTITTNPITISIGTTAATVTDSLDYMISAVTGYASARWTRPVRPGPANHRGVAIRSHDRGQQFQNANPAELVALQLLRKMVSPDQFRRYLRHGFVSVHGNSGLVYQIDRMNRIRVWDRGEPLASLCVHLRGQGIPPTDEVVGKMLIVECDEADIWRRSNVTWLTAARDRCATRALGLAVAA